MTVSDVTLMSFNRASLFRPDDYHSIVARNDDSTYVKS